MIISCAFMSALYLIYIHVNVCVHTVLHVKNDRLTEIDLGGEAFAQT